MQSAIDNRKSAIPMKLAYIAGPYRAESEYGVHCNIQLAEKAAARAWRSGYAVICPHKNSAYLGGVVDDAVILEGDLEMLRRCQVIILCGEWEKSEGAKAELAEAQRLGLVVCDYDAGRDRIVQRKSPNVQTVDTAHRAVAHPMQSTIENQKSQIPLGRCSYCSGPQGDPRRVWLMPDGGVMCGVCAAQRRWCHGCRVPLVEGFEATADAGRFYWCRRCEAEHGPRVPPTRRAAVQVADAACDDGVVFGGMGGTKVDVLA